MSSARTMFWNSVAVLGLMLGMSAMPTMALEKKEDVKPVAKGEKIDVNHATEKEMEAELEGVGEVTAKKIVEGRPYKTIEDLVKAGVSQKTADKIAPHITFGKAEKKADKTDKKEEPKATKTDKKEEPKATKTDKKEEPKVAKTDKKADKDEVEAKVAPKKGMVWVNTESKIFHVEGDRWYGKTKKGEFMTEEDAIKAGARKSKD